MSDARKINDLHRLLTVGVSVAVAAVAIGTPLALSSPKEPTSPVDAGSMPTPPTGGWVGPDGEPWRPHLDGVDLPVGGPLSVPYLDFRNGDQDGNGQTLVSEAGRTPAPDGHGGFYDVPGGVVMTAGIAPLKDGPYVAARLELLKSDGELDVLDAGVIAGATAVRQPDGSVLLVYAVWPDGDSSDGQIRVLQLGSDAQPRVFPVAQPTIDGTFAASSFVDGTGSRTRILVAGQPTLFDVSSGAMEPDSSVLGISASGNVIEMDGQCLVTREPRGAEHQVECRPDVRAIRLSPDGRLIATPKGAYDADTGDQVASFPLPATGSGQSSSEGSRFRVQSMSWEKPEVPIFTIEDQAATQDGPMSEAYVGIRCSVGTGACEYLPQFVDAFSQNVR